MRKVDLYSFKLMENGNPAVLVCLMELGLIGLEKKRPHCLYWSIGITVKVGQQTKSQLKSFSGSHQGDYSTLYSLKWDFARTPTSRGSGPNP